MSRSRSSVDLRRTSVGCVVRTGLIEARLSVSLMTATVWPASCARFMASAIEPLRGADRALRCARLRRMWCWSSAMLARWEK